jgi:tRNA(fMet)-specific endonuclease VapC
MVKYLLDTNAISEPFRPAPDVRFLKRYRAHAGELGIASTTWHEAMFGMARLPDGKRKRAVERYLNEVVLPTMEVLPYTRAAAEWHAHERARLERRGRALSFADGQIGAVAAVNGLTLVTRNTKDFAAFEGLNAVDWTE